MRKTNAEMSTLLQKVVRDGKASDLDDRVLSHAERLSKKYMMRHIMESARGVFTNDAWIHAFSHIKNGDHRLTGYMGSFGMQKRLWLMARDEFNRYREDLPAHNANLTPVISRAYNDALDVLDSPAAYDKVSMRPCYEWKLWVVAGCAVPEKTWRLLSERRWVNRWDEFSIPIDSKVRISGFQLGIDGQEIADGDILLALTCPNTSEFEGQTRLLKLPISWGRQVERLGTATIGNKIVKRAKYIGMFGDVEGYQVTLYRRGVKPTDFTEEDVYVGKLDDTIQICKSRMYIKSVTRRKVGANVGAELLGAFD